MQKGKSTAEERETFREFNRFYVNLMGLFNKAYLGQDMPLAQARVLYEIWSRPGCTAAVLGRVLTMDRGGLSRVLDKLARAGLVGRTAAKSDARLKVLRLTAAGEQKMRELIGMSSAHAASVLDGLSPADRHRLLDSMGVIYELLGKDGER